jgi:flagellar biogenesis protein FliO
MSLAVEAVVASGAPATIAPTKTNSLIPFKQDPQPAAASPVLVSVALLLVLLGAWWWMRKHLERGALRGRERRARVLESHRLGPRSTLAVVEFAGQLHLLAQTENSVTCVARAPAGESP